MRSLLLRSLASISAAVMMTGAVVGSTGCGDSDDIDTYLIGLGELPLLPLTNDRNATSPPYRDGIYRCQDTQVDQVEHADEIITFSASSGLWPGALLRGGSVSTGVPAEVVLPRTPVRFSISVPELATAARTMTNPTLSSFRAELGDILRSEMTNKASGNGRSFKSSTIHSEDHLRLHLGVAYDGVSTDVEANFDFSDSSVQTRMLIEFTESYYTVDIDPPSQPSDVFARNVTVDDVKAKFDEANPPMIVSSMTYGRKAYFAFESDKTEQEIRASLEAEFSGGISVNTELEMTKIATQGRMRAITFGGAGKAVTTYEEGLAWIRASEGFSAESPGALIGYKLKYLASGSIALLAKAGSYIERQCEIDTDTYLAKLVSFTTSGSGSDAFDFINGRIDLVLSTGSGAPETVRLWSGARNVAANSTMEVSSQAVFTLPRTPGATLRILGSGKENDCGFCDDDPVSGNLLLTSEMVWSGVHDLHITGDEDGMSLTARIEFVPQAPSTN